MDEDTLIDPEDQLLADLEAEEAAAAQAAQPPVEAVVETPDTTPEPVIEPEPTATAQAEIMIPKARLDQSLGRVRELELENARLRGLEEGLKTAGAPTATQPPAPTTDPAADRLIAIESEKDAVWAKYDAGELTMTEMKQAERKLEAEAGTLRDVIADRRKAPAQPHAADVNGDLRLNEMTNDLANKNAWIGHVPPEYLVKSVMPLAEQLLASRGQPVTNDPAGAYRLRWATVEIAKKMGAYRIFAPPELWPAEEGAVPPTPPAATQAPTPTAKLTPAQIQEKIALSRKQPPDLSSAGTSLPSEITSAKDIEDMSEDELAQLSETEQERLAPSRAR